MLVNTKKLLYNITNNIKILENLLEEEKIKYSKKINSKRKFWKALMSFGLWRHVDRHYELSQNSSYYQAWREITLKELRKREMVQLALDSGQTDFDMRNF